MNTKSQSTARRGIASAQSVPNSAPPAWKRWTSHAALALAVAASLVPRAAQAGKPVKPPPGPAYIPVVLGGLRSLEGGISTYASDINNAGQVVGNTSIPGYPYTQYAQPFLLNPRDTNEDGKPDTWFVDEVQNATGVTGSDGQNDLIIGLGNLPGARHGLAIAVNDYGLAVGTSDFYDQATQVGRTEAFIVMPIVLPNGAKSWYQDSNKDGVNDLMVPLGSLNGNGESCEPFAINNSGQIVGWCYTLDASGVYQTSGGFLLTPLEVAPGVRQWFQDNGRGGNSLMFNLGTFIPSRINDTGQIVGTSAGRAMFRNSEGPLIDLGPAGTQSEGRTMNNRGQVGLSFQLDVWHAGLLTPVDTNNDGKPEWYRDLNKDGVNDLIVDLGGVGGLDSSYVAKHGLNDTVSVVGGSWQSTGRYAGMRRAPFLWQNGVLQTLKSLTGGTIEFWDVYAINNAGQIVCQSTGDGFYQNGNAYILLPKP